MINPKISSVLECAFIVSLDDATNPFSVISVLKKVKFLIPNLRLQNTQKTVREAIPNICKLIFL